MEEKLKESGEIDTVYRHAGSKPLNAPSDSTFYRANPRHLVVNKSDDRIGATGDNSPRAVEQHGIEPGQETSRVPTKAIFQGRSGLVQVPVFKGVTEGEFVETNPYVYADLTGILGQHGMGSGGSSEIEMLMAERVSNAYIGGKYDHESMRGTHNTEEVENRSNGGSGSHGARLADFQRLSLSSDHNSDHPAAKVKFMCSFGGKIFPRPSDGKLRYVGGETRIITVNKGIAYKELMQKLTDAYGQALMLKYQLPDEDLDALVSVSSDEDLENMMEEYDRLEGGEGSLRLRVFLFSAVDYDLTHFDAMGDRRNSQQQYVNAVNGIPEAGYRKHADSVRSASLQQLENMIALEVAEKWSGTPRAQEGIPEFFPPVQIAQDIADPLASKQTMTQSSHPLSSLEMHPKSFGVEDVPGHFFPGMHLKVGGHSYTTLQAPEGQHDLEYGGPTTSSATSQYDLHYRLPESSAPGLPTKVHPVFSLPTTHPDLVYGTDQRVNDSKLPRIESHGKLTQFQECIEVRMPMLDHMSDMQLPPVDSHPPPIVCQPQRQHHLDAHQDSYRRMEYTQQARFDGGYVQQHFQHHSPLSAQLNNHAVPSKEAAMFRVVDQAQQHQEDVLGGSYLQKFASTQQSGHAMVGTSALHLVDSEPVSPCLAGRQIGGQQHMQVQRSSDAPGLEQQEYGTTVYHYNNQGSSIFCPSISRDVYIDPMAEQFPHQQALLSEQQLGCQQGIPCEQVSHSNLFIHPQAVRHTLLQEHGIKPVHPLYEGFHLNGSVRPVTSYAGPSTLQGLMSIQDHQEIGGESSGSGQQAKDSQPIMSGLQGYTGMPGSSGHVVQQQSLLAHFHERPNGIESGTRHLVLGLKAAESNIKDEVQISELLESSHEDPGKTYPGVCFSDDIKSFLSADLDNSNQICQKPEMSELMWQMNEMAVSTSLPQVQEVRTVHALTEHAVSHQVVVTRSESPTADQTPIEKLGRIAFTHHVSTAGAEPCIPEIWWGDRLDTDLAKGQVPMYAPGQAGNLGEDGPKDALPLITSDKTHRPVDSHDTSVLNENSIDFPCVSENHAADLTTKSAIDDSNVHSAPVQPDILSYNLLDKFKKASSIPESLALPISISDSDMLSVLPSNLKSAENLLSSNADEPSVVMHSPAKDCASLPSNISVSFDFQREGEQVVSTYAVMQDNSDEYVKGDLQNLAEDVAEAVLRPTLLPAPNLSMHEWAQVNEDVKIEEHGKVIDGLEEENIAVEDSISEEVKIEDSDNDDPISDAVMAEAEANVRGLQTIKNADLEELRELGSGTFGTVYHGKWRGSDVAIKRIKNSCFSGRPSQQERLCITYVPLFNLQRADFWSEACMLAQLHHPNVVAFYGIVPDGPGGTLGTVTEYMVNGSLKQVLQRKDRTIDRRKRLLIATDAAFGMEYLHGKNIVHFDLKCENLLVNMRDPQRPICKMHPHKGKVTLIVNIWTALIHSEALFSKLPWENIKNATGRVPVRDSVADFGLSKIKHQTLVSGGVRGTLPWMAPELLNGSSNRVSEKVDVFSFGIVMWELLTGEEPYASMHYGAIIGGIVSNTLRPPVPNWCDPAWRSLMEQCWSADPAARPSFTEIANELRGMATSLQPRGQGHQASVQAHAQKRAQA
eukprot:Gb_32796 [translate_table: standard]